MDRWGWPTSEVREADIRTPAADIFLADLAVDDVLPLEADEDLDNPSELLARMGFCKLATASGLTMILIEDL